MSIRLTCCICSRSEDVEADSDEWWTVPRPLGDWALCPSCAGGDGGGGDRGEGGDGPAQTAGLDGSEAAAEDPDGR
jgi:hypothetical protein